MYVNGVCENSENGQQYRQADANFYIGASAAYNTDYFLGDIDDVRVYNRALSAQEVQQLYAGASIMQPSVQFEPGASGAHLHTTIQHGSGQRRLDAAHDVYRPGDEWQSSVHHGYKRDTTREILNIDISLP